MIYGNSCEEHKYLAGIRKEKDCFQRLIKERGVGRNPLPVYRMLTRRMSVYVTADFRGPWRRERGSHHQDNQHSDCGRAPGDKQGAVAGTFPIWTEYMFALRAVVQVIVDMREFRSTLPSLIHASNVLVIPATLTVGDYILTPDICVERKSLPDLISSFNSGRL
jgi:DNA excision repair protein ERCC-4